MSDVLLQITSGRGPVECAWVVAQQANILVGEARGAGLQAALIEEEHGPENGTLLSALIHLAEYGCTVASALMAAIGI
jgi:peptide chain release factor